MGGISILENSETLFFIIFTDLDGTLLDHDTYEWEKAKPAIELCSELEVPVVLVSSKTRTEMELLRRKMSISSPFITENGGGIFFPGKAFKAPATDFTYVSGPEGLWKLSLGLPYHQLVKALKDIREELGLNLRGFSDMKVDEISQLTGLDQEASRLASMREYDEPFILIDPSSLDKSILIDAAQKRGLSITMGGRFFHLQGGNDKGLAVDIVIAWYKTSHSKIMTIGLGDSPNDFPMLKRVDYPILIRSKGDYSSLKTEIPRLKITSEMGPAGWNSAVLDILRNQLSS